MSKSIFREIHQGDDVSDIIVRCMASVFGVAVVVMLLLAGWAMYQNRTESGAETYRRELIQREADQEWRKAERNLRKKHGSPGVIYEPGREPYYIDKNGRKCRYI